MGQEATHTSLSATVEAVSPVVLGGSPGKVFPVHPSSSAVGMVAPTALRSAAKGVVGQAAPALTTPGLLTAGLSPSATGC